MQPSQKDKYKESKTNINDNNEKIKTKQKFEEVFQSGFTVEKYGATPNGVGKLLNPSQEIEELTEQVENLQKQLTECNNKYIIYRQQSTPSPPRNTRYRKPGDNLYVD